MDGVPGIPMLHSLSSGFHGDKVSHVMNIEFLQ